MCGIGGCVSPPGRRPSLERLEAMRDALRHRGPDGSGVEIIGNVGLVHTRLAIIDVSESARQPMCNASRDWWLSYNGEIYNHETIRRELPDQEYASAGDTETLLHALARWGPATFIRLNGQFAVAALDLARNRLLLARDRFGIKPLYVAESDDGMWFASEPAALLAAGIEASPRADGFQSLLDSSFYPGEATLLESVDRLAPGTCWEIALDTGAVTRHRWDAHQDHVDRSEQTRLQASSRSALVSELEATLRAAVHDALLSDVPVGTLCSGGVDSSLITALALEVSQDLVAFGAGYQGSDAVNEGPAARRVADSLGIEFELLEVTEPVWRSGFVAATLHFGAPLHNASSVPIAQMADRARRRGIKVLLTGEGADELFGGYMGLDTGVLTEFLSPRQREARRLERWAFQPPRQSIRALARRIAKVTKVHAATDPPGSPSGERRITGATDPSDLEDAYGHHPGPRGALETTLLRDLDVTLSHLLNRMDKNMMQVSVEARVPFLDPRVVALALNMPLESRVTPWSKGVLRDVARKFLPFSCAHRPKIMGMTFDAGAWVERAADPRFLSGGLLQDVFRVPADEFADVVDRASATLRFRLWSAEVWARSVFAGDSQATIERELWPHGV